jgi:hypothetical protein
MFPVLLEQGDRKKSHICALQAVGCSQFCVKYKPGANYLSVPLQL